MPGPLLGKGPLWFDSCKRPLTLCILRGRLREVRLDFLLASDIFGGHVFKYNDPQTVTLDLEVDKKTCSRVLSGLENLG